MHSLQDFGAPWIKPHTRADRTAPTPRTRPPQAQRGAVGVPPGTRREAEAAPPAARTPPPRRLAERHQPSSRHHPDRHRRGCPGSLCSRWAKPTAVRYSLLSISSAQAATNGLAATVITAGLVYHTAPAARWKRPVSVARREVVGSYSCTAALLAGTRSSGAAGLPAYGALVW